MNKNPHHHYNTVMASYLSKKTRRFTCVFTHSNHSNVCGPTYRGKQHHRLKLVETMGHVPSTALQLVINNPRSLQAVYQLDTETWWYFFITPVGVVGFSWMFYGCFWLRGEELGVKVGMGWWLAWWFNITWISMMFFFWGVVLGRISVINSFFFWGGDFPYCITWKIPNKTTSLAFENVVFEWKFPQKGGSWSRGTGKRCLWHRPFGVYPRHGRQTCSEDSE